MGSVDINVGGFVGTMETHQLQVVVSIFHRLEPTGYVKHHQFNVRQLYVLPTLYICVLYLSENKQRLVPLTA